MSLDKLEAHARKPCAAWREEDGEHVLYVHHFVACVMSCCDGMFCGELVFIGHMGEAATRVFNKQKTVDAMKLLIEDELGLIQHGIYKTLSSSEVIDVEADDN